MNRIDDSIKRIDNVICRHLDSIDNSTRGAISQDILEQLNKLVNHIMLKFYSKGAEIDITEDNILKATEFAQVTYQINSLYKFKKFLQVVTTEFTLDEDGAERLMLKYYGYLLDAKQLLLQYFNFEILHNIDKFPLRLDSTLQEYYEKIAERIECYPTATKVSRGDRYYILKKKQIFIKHRTYYEITFTPVNDKRNKSKSDRVIAFTKLPIIDNYASKFHLVQETITIHGKTMPILIIDGWEVSIRDCEFKNFTSLINGERRSIPEKSNF